MKICMNTYFQISELQFWHLLNFFFNNLNFRKKNCVASVRQGHTLIRNQNVRNEESIVIWATSDVHIVISKRRIEELCFFIDQIIAFSI